VGDDSAVFEQAVDVGRAIAESGGIVLCGGGGGVMRGAALGARSAGGHSIGVLPHDGPTDAELGLPRMSVATSAADAVGLAFAAIGLSVGGRIAAPVSVPTIHDQTTNLARLAAWVDALP